MPLFHNRTGKRIEVGDRVVIGLGTATLRAYLVHAYAEGRIVHVEELDIGTAGMAGRRTGVHAAKKAADIGCSWVSRGPDLPEAA